MAKSTVGFVLALCACAVQAQGTPQAPSSPPPMQTPTSTTTSPEAQAPQRGFIAPIVDIRIQGEGISLPKSAGEAEKPPAK